MKVDEIDKWKVLGVGSALYAGPKIFQRESARKREVQGVCEVGKVEYAKYLNFTFLFGPPGGLNGESERHRNRLGTEPGVHISAPAKKRPCQSAVKFRGGPFKSDDFFDLRKRQNHEITKIQMKSKFLQLPPTQWLQLLFLGSMGLQPHR